METNNIANAGKPPVNRTFRGGEDASTSNLQKICIVPIPDSDLEEVEPFFRSDRVSDQVSVHVREDCVEMTKEFIQELYQGLPAQDSPPNTPEDLSLSRASYSVKENTVPPSSSPIASQYSGLVATGTVFGCVGMVLSMESVGIIPFIYIGANAAVWTTLLAFLGGFALGMLLYKACEFEILFHASHKGDRNSVLERGLLMLWAVLLATVPFLVVTYPFHLLPVVAALPVGTVVGITVAWMLLVIASHCAHLAFRYTKEDLSPAKRFCCVLLNHVVGVITPISLLLANTVGILVLTGYASFLPVIPGLDVMLTALVYFVYALVLGKIIHEVCMAGVQWMGEKVCAKGSIDSYFHPIGEFTRASSIAAPEGVRIVVLKLPEKPPCETETDLLNPSCIHTPLIS